MNAERERESSPRAIMHESVPDKATKGESCRVEVNPRWLICCMRHFTYAGFFSALSKVRGGTQTGPVFGWNVHFMRNHRKPKSLMTYPLFFVCVCGLGTFVIGSLHCSHLLFRKWLICLKAEVFLVRDTWDHNTYRISLGYYVSFWRESSVFMWEQG